MSAKTYWKLLVLFVVLCQGIIGTIAENDIDESSELLIRQKRVINRQPGGDNKQPIKNAPYIVRVKELYRNGGEFCIGVIMSTHVALTLAKCVSDTIESVKVYSGTAQRSFAGMRVMRHSVSSKLVRMSNNPSNPEEGIALIRVILPFAYSINTRSIELYEGHIQPRTYAIVSGWGCHADGHPGTVHPDYLRSIRVPIISNRDCAVFYRDVFRISDSHICTFDSTGDQYCGANDDGAPLVVIANTVPKLVGLHVKSVRGSTGWVHPDVFINLEYPRYKTWIAQNLEILTRTEHTY